jgi:streptogramin lyase
MLEQAVYARRNHTAILAVALFTLLNMPAQAADTVRVGLNSSIQQLVGSPDGGAWLHVHALERQRVMRITPQGAVRVTPVDWVDRGALGPDGQAWFKSGSGITRFDADGVMSTLPVGRVTSGIAAGPDGTAWLAGPEPVRLAPDGTTAPLSLTVPGCEGYPGGLARASDGAMWFDVSGCGLVRLPPGGTPRIVAKEVLAAKLAPDAHGGFWFAHHVAPGGGHVDVTGRVKPLRRTGVRGTQDVAVAPDGSAWYATGRCHLLRAAGDGSVRRHPISVPAQHLAFDPAGGLWLASAKRLVRTTVTAPAGRCDDTPPTATIVPDPSKPVSAAALRRHGGFKITVREPFWIESAIFDPDGDETLADVLTSRRGGTTRIRLSDSEIRAFARRKGTPLSLTGELRDREGNSGGYEFDLRFRP